MEKRCGFAKWPKWGVAQKGGSRLTSAEQGTVSLSGAEPSMRTSSSSEPISAWVNHHEKCHQWPDSLSGPAVFAIGQTKTRDVEKKGVKFP